MQIQPRSRRSSESFWSCAILVATVVLTLGQTIASAHPGHGLDAEPVSHFLTSPYHLLFLTLIGIGLLLGAAFVQRLATRRAMQLTGVTALVIAVATAATQLFH